MYSGRRAHVSTCAACAGFWGTGLRIYKRRSYTEAAASSQRGFVSALQLTRAARAEAHAERGPAIGGGALGNACYRSRLERCGRHERAGRR